MTTPTNGKKKTKKEKKKKIEMEKGQTEFRFGIDTWAATHVRSQISNF